MGVMTPRMKQGIMAMTADEKGEFYYNDKLDGIWGPKSQAAAERFLADFGVAKETATESNTAMETPGNAVLVFSLKDDGNKNLSEHFKVREFACNDGSDVVFIHPILPTWCEEMRKINGPFSPKTEGSAYRTVSYNASIDGAASYSRHCWGIAVDIPAKNATPEELYALAEQIMGDTGGLGIYDWGIHMDPRPVKSRWDSRKK